MGERIRGAIRGMPDPDPVGMFNAVYAEPHPQVEADRQAFIAASTGQLP